MVTPLERLPDTYLVVSPFLRSAKSRGSAGWRCGLARFLRAARASVRLPARHGARDQKLAGDFDREFSAPQYMHNRHVAGSLGHVPSRCGSRRFSDTQHCEVSSWWSMPTSTFRSSPNLAWLPSMSARKDLNPPEKVD